MMLRLLRLLVIVGVMSAASLATIVRPLPPNVITARNADQVRPLYIVHAEVPMYVATYSPDGSRIVVSAHDGMHIFDADGRSLLQLAGGAAQLQVAFSPDGRYLASANSDDHYQIWDTATGELLCHHDVGEWNVSFPQFSPDSHTIAVAALYLPEVKLWDVATCTNFANVIPPSNASDSTADADFSPDGRHLVVADTNGVVRLWDVAAWRVIHTRDLHRDISSVSYSFDGTSVLIRGYGHSEVWAADLSARWFVSGYGAWNVKMQPMGHAMLYAINADLWWWDGQRDHAPILVRSRVTEGMSWALSPYPNTTLAVFEHPDRLQIINIRTREVAADLRVDQYFDPGDMLNWGPHVMYNPDGTRILTVSNSGEVVIWGIE